MACVRWESVAGEAEVACRITGLGVRVGQGVAKGQLLFQFDPNPYALTVAKANAAINSARVDVGNLSAGLATTQVDIAKAKEDIAFAEVNFQRQAALMDKGFTTRAAYDASRHAVEQAREIGEHTSELQSLMRISYAVFCLKKKIPSSGLTRQ